MLEAGAQRVVERARSDFKLQAAIDDDVLWLLLSDQPLLGNADCLK